jgi:general secretion pathway protein C
MAQKKYTLLSSALTALLVVLLGIASAQVFWQAYDYWLVSDTTVPAIATLPRTTATLSNTPDYADVIGSAHLFGRPLASSEVDKVVTEDIPNSLLNVTIKGILALADDANSMAILSVENAVDEVFKTGDELKTGYSIHQIIANGVVVDFNGRLEMVRLPRATLADITANIESVNENSSLGLGVLRAEVMRNPLALEQHISFAPHAQNGQFVGYRVNQGSKPELFIKLGLQADDIVSSVDGVGIGQLAGRMDILTNLSVAKNLRLGVIRNGQEQQLLVDFSQ